MSNDSDYFTEIGESNTIQYICSCTTGNAFNILEPRNPATCEKGVEFTSRDEVLDTLRLNFMERNRTENAMRDLDDLKQGSLSFRDFYNKYLSLYCQTPQISDDHIRRHHLTSKLSPRLYTEWNTRHRFRTKTFTELVEVLYEINDSFQDNDKKHPRNKKAGNESRAGNSNTRGSNTTASGKTGGNLNTAKKDPGLYPEKYKGLPLLTKKLRASPKAVNKCYAYREAGHDSYSTNCPLWPWSKFNPESTNYDPNARRPARLVENHNTEIELPADQPANELLAEN